MDNTCFIRFLQCFFLSQSLFYIDSKQTKLLKITCEKSSIIFKSVSQRVHCSMHGQYFTMHSNFDKY